MKILLALLVIYTSVLFPSSAAFAEEEEVRHKDIPHFSGMPNYVIADAADKEFDEYNFFDNKQVITVEGKKWVREYQLKENAKQASELQITRNYANAVRSMSGAVLFEGICTGEQCEGKGGWRIMVGKATKGDQELWVEVAPYNDGFNYTLTVLEKEAMKQAVTASGMLTALNTEGHVAVYLNFDTGRAIIKPESQQIIDQIVVLMKSNPGLKLSVEGHTDNVGSPQKNKILSEERARSVVIAVVNQGIDAKRLTAAGFGQDKPIADNKTEEGRAKNRRVELVKK